MKITETRKHWYNSRKLAEEMGQKDNFNFTVGVLKNSLNLEEKEFYNVFSNFLAYEFQNNLSMTWSKILENLVSGDIPLDLRPDRPSNLPDFTDSKDKGKEEDLNKEIKDALSLSAF